MKPAIRWISDWRHALTAMGFAALAIVAAIFVPERRWEKLGELIERIAEDPAGAAVIVSVIAGAVTTLRGAWMRQPPPAALVLLAALACAAPLTGCGASALRTHATIGSVAAVTLGQAAPLVAPACDVALTQCRGEVACVTETAERCRVATGAVEGLVLVTRGYLDAIEVASLADEGEVMPALLTGLSRLVVRWAEVVALLGRFGVALPALPALASSLLGGGS